ncbi:MAG: hypothetical protein JSU87_10475 [Gemmatimonadota bacterium]|nr:MAG: hypothetical protein JSU87_10475 [Gemmatimonadota bacterium]
MTRSRVEPNLRVAAFWRRVTAQFSVAAIGGAIAAAGASLVSAWCVSGSALWRRPSVLPLLFGISTLVLIALWFWRIGRRAAGWNRRAAVAEIEQRAGMRRGSVQSAIEPGPKRPGVSGSLFDLHRAQVASRLRSSDLERGGRGIAHAARASMLLAIVMAAVALAGVATVMGVGRERALTAWAAVLSPVEHLRPPQLPAVRLSASLLRVRRGHDLPVAVEALQRDSALLHWRPRGEVARVQWKALTGGRALASIPRIAAPTQVWATTADGASSDTLHVEPFDPLLLLDLRIGLRFPPHTGREAEVLATPLPQITVPQGTRATVSGKTTRPVAGVELRADSGRVIALQVRGEREFQGSFLVRPGSWGWAAAGTQAEALEGNPDSLRFLTVPDSAPLVLIRYPGVDTALDASMTQPLLVELRDDYGLSRVELVSWRVSAWGESATPAVEPLPAGGASSRASLSPLLDARGRGLLPGDTLRYYVQAHDNAPRPQLGRSREYALRLPDLEEVRERALAEARDLVDAAELLAEQARQHRESAEALARDLGAPAPATQRANQREGGIEFRDAETARQALDEATELLTQSRALQESLRQLQESVEQAGLRDPEVIEGLREIQALYERVLTPELEEKLEALRTALGDLDAEQLRDAIRQLAEGATDFRESVERSVELLRRAALEQEFETLETRAAELGDSQQQLAEALGDAEPADDSLAAGLEQRAGDLAERAEQLAEAVGELTAELKDSQESDAAAQAADAESAVEGAARADQEVARALPGDRRRAEEAARQALAKLRQAAQSLRQGREEMQEGWRQEVAQALQRTQVETLELARRQQELGAKLDSDDATDRAEARAQQAALRRAVGQVERQLADAAGSSLLLDPELIDEAARIGQTMDELLAQLSDATRDGRGDPLLGDRAGESLNELAFHLMRAGDAASAAQSGTGVQEALAQLAQLAEQQGALNAQAGGLGPGAAEAIWQELQRLAGQQRGIADEIAQLEGSLGPRGEVLGRLGDLAQEAEELARQLEQGRLNDDVVRRQGELYRRLLDAGRTLERDEFDRERRAERPGRVEVLRPDELPPELLRGLRFPHPNADALDRYPPVLRRLILEYFDRLNQAENDDGS